MLILLSDGSYSDYCVNDIIDVDDETYRRILFLEKSYEEEKGRNPYCEVRDPRGVEVTFGDYLINNGVDLGKFTSLKYHEVNLHPW